YETGTSHSLTSWDLHDFLMTVRELLDRRDRTNIWLNGLAGVGKTSIAFTVAEEMKKAKRLAATFFFSHKHAQSGAKVIPTIAYQSPHPPSSGVFVIIQCH
ncbi:hypothetical protein M405DRAFT_870499, partial [Rhizopogon salebrosus TDB-379]